MITPDELVPIDEACRRLGVGQSTLYRGLELSQIPGGRKIGGRWIIARAVFDRWLVDGIEPGEQAEQVGNPFIKHVDPALALVEQAS